MVSNFRITHINLNYVIIRITQESKVAGVLPIYEFSNVFKKSVEKSTEINRTGNQQLSAMNY